MSLKELYPCLLPADLLPNSMLELGCVGTVEGVELVQLTVKQCFGHVVEGHSGDGCLRTVQHHVEAHDHSLYLLEDLGVTELDKLALISPSQSNY